MKAKIATIVLLVVLCSAATNAQMRYFNGNLTITAPFSYSPTTLSCGMTVQNWSSVYFGVNGTGALRFDLTANGAFIAGANDKVIFQDIKRNVYNSIHVANVYNHSDARAKEDVKNMNLAVPTLLQLRPVTFKWKESVSPLNATAEGGAAADSLSLPAGTDNGVQYGFIAQEVEEVLPDIVRTEENGEKLVNYTALIPLLVQSVQELQKTVEAQAAMIEQLSGTQGLAKRNSYNKILGCTPNPTSGQVTVETQIAENITSAQIVISSLSGNREMLVKVSAAEQTVDVNVSGLTDGIHIVSLYINGQLVDSCRLIKE